MLDSKDYVPLIPKILGSALVRGQQLKDDGAYFKIKKTKQIKFLSFAFFEEKSKQDPKSHF